MSDHLLSEPNWIWVKWKWKYNNWHQSNKPKIDEKFGFTLFWFRFTLIHILSFISIRRLKIIAFRLFGMENETIYIIQIKKKHSFVSNEMKDEDLKSPKHDKLKFYKIKIKMRDSSHTNMPIWNPFFVLQAKNLYFFFFINK